MKVLRTLSSILLAVERTLVVSILAVMVVLAFLQVVLRNVFDTGILWADTFLRHMVLWIGFLGASLAAEAERHIGIDIITRFLAKKLQHIARIITHLFAAVVCMMLAEASFTFLSQEREWGAVVFTLGTTDVLSWHVQVIIPFGFSLIAFRFVLRIIEHTAALLGKHSEAVLPPSGSPSVRREKENA